MNNIHSRVRLRAILLNVDFRKSEVSNYEEFKASRRFPGALRANETYLLVSKRANQLLWFLEHSGDKGVYDTRKWRLMEGTWNPDLLEEYANLVGLSLIGIRSFRDAFLAERKRKAELVKRNESDTKVHSYYEVNE